MACSTTICRRAWITVWRRVRSSIRSPAISPGSHGKKWNRSSKGRGCALAADEVSMATLFLSREAVRALDRRAIEEFGVPAVVLMENAGRGTAELLLALGCRGPVVLCCGKGNNGGDGFVIARHLDNLQIPVRVLLFCSPPDLVGE